MTHPHGALGENVPLALINTRSSIPSGAAVPRQPEAVITPWNRRSPCMLSMSRPSARGAMVDRKAWRVGSYGPFSTRSSRRGVARAPRRSLPGAGHRQ
jgi:hypothetical protein